MYYTSGTITVWLTQKCIEKITNDRAEKELLDTVISNTEKIIIPRDTALWGKCADINADGTLAVLFSDTINDEETAVGFFNPEDFFANDTDESGSGYNPASNEMDILYIALPDASKSSYSVDSITATTAHELAHAVNFTVKTYDRIKAGNNDAPQEQTFLDEGWSHLTENLCGFGVSGGNIFFFRKFLLHPEYYSFCEDNSAGESDCIGQRGAMTLFLSWLFWKAGGMAWSSSDPVQLIDTGGITFLRKMTAGDETGWSSIGDAFGENTEKLFFEMVDNIQKAQSAGTEYISRKDPLTGEPVDFFVNMNTDYDGDYAGFPAVTSYSNGSSNMLLPWSFHNLGVWSFSGEEAVTVRGEYTDGTVFIKLTPCE